MATPRKSAQPSKSSQRRMSAKASPRRGSGNSSGASSRSAQNGQSETSTPARKSLRAIAVSAAAELAQLIGQVPEAIVGAEKTETGWRVQIEVVESHRIPETTDILAVYEVDVDGDGGVTGYRRADRYIRGRIQE